MLVFLFCLVEAASMVLVRREGVQITDHAQATRLEDEFQLAAGGQETPDDEPCCCDEEEGCYDESGEAPECCFPDDAAPELAEGGASALEVADEPTAAAAAATQVLIGGALVDTSEHLAVPVIQGAQFSKHWARNKAISEIVIHESNIAGRERTVEALEGKEYGAHFMVDFDGSVRQHGDLARGLSHAGYHNNQSIGIEVVNPYFAEIYLGKFLRPPVKVGFECKSKETKPMTTYRATRNADGTGGYVQRPITQVQHCLSAAVDKGYKYVIFGKGSKKNKCFGEKTTEDDNGNVCPEGWEEKEYDFYKVEDTAIRAKWAGRKRYVLPSLEQCEAVTSLLAFLTAGRAEGPLSVLEIPRTWAGLVEGSEQRRDGSTKTWTRLANNRLDKGDGRTPWPGIHAHQYSAHGDGSFNVLYSYLRLDHNLEPEAAYREAVRIAKTIKYVNGFPGMDIRDKHFKKTGKKIGKSGTAKWRKYYKPLKASCWNIDI